MGTTVCRICEGVCTLSCAVVIPVFLGEAQLTPWSNIGQAGRVRPRKVGAQVVGGQGRPDDKDGAIRLLSEQPKRRVQRPRPSLGP